MSEQPNWAKGYIPTADEWNNWFARKLDNTDPAVIGGPFLPITGGTLLGSLTLGANSFGANDAVTKSYVDSHSGSGGLVDAPMDGSTYGRNSAAWVVVDPLNNLIDGGNF
jgi:hypothetical protein